MRDKSFELGAEPSAIRVLFEYGKKKRMEAGEESVFDYSIGNPSAPVPAVVKETLIELLENTSDKSLHGYTIGAGDHGVRDAIAEYLNRAYSAHTEGSLIYLTCGAAAALSIAFHAILNSGDEVILFAPHFPEYKAFVEFAGGKCVTVQPEPSAFQPDFEDFKRKIGPKTRMVIINSPNNPSGTLYSRKTVETLASILHEKQKEYGHPIYLLSDEPYRELIYDEIEYPFPTNYYENSLVAYSFSKVLSLPGERIGYLLVNPACEKAKDIFLAVCGAGRALGYVCAPSLFQHMIPSCLGAASNMSLYKRNRDFLYRSLLDLGYEMIYPAGAFYLLLKALGEDAKVFSEKAKELNLLLVPCDTFGIKGYVRLAYCVPYSMIERSLGAFAKLKEMYGR